MIIRPFRVIDITVRRPIGQLLIIILKEDLQVTDYEKNQVTIQRRQGKSYSEISGKLGISVSALKTFCCRHNIKPGQTVNPVYKCKWCGEAFDPGTRGREKQFCGRHCYNRWWHSTHPNNRTYYQRVCGFCGKQFTTTAKRQKFCSAQCYQENRKAENDAKEQTEV